MIKRTTYEYNIRHAANEMDRLEILEAFHSLAKMVEDEGLATVTVRSEKSDLIYVTIETEEEL